MKRMLAALMLLLVGCRQPETFYAFAFEGLPEDYPEAVAAANEWDNCGVVTTHIDEGRAFKEAIPIVYSAYTLYDIPDGGIAGICYGYSIEYTHKGDVRAILIHEMGHAMGLPHSEHGIMQAHLSDSLHVTPYDCQALRDR